MSEYSFGIDLGTSTSEISYLVGGKPVPISDPHTKSPIVPSVVALDRRGQVLVGQSALDDGLPQETIREAKRKMGADHRFKLGDQSLLPEEVAAKVLEKLKSIAKTSLGVEVNEAVITVPAYFTDLERRATMRAAHLAGITPLRLISEPVAAALAYGIERLDEHGMLLVFDFGGGTLDVTIIEMIAGVLDVKATDGDSELGGKDIDEALMEFATQKAGRGLPARGSISWEPLKKKLESAKKSLSEIASVSVHVEALEYEGTIYDLDLDITRDEFEDVIKPIIDKAAIKVQGALDKAGVDKRDVTHLLMVGGTSYIPAIRNAIEKRFGWVSDAKVIDRDLAVTLGAAISAGLKSGEIDTRTSVVVQDSATHRMGIRSLGVVGEQAMSLFSEMIPANASVPWVRTERYHLLRLDQDMVEIQVLQDVKGNAVLAADATETGASGIIRDIPPSTTPEPRSLDIEFRYDENHIIEVTGKVVGIDRAVAFHVNKALLNPDPLTTMGSSQPADINWTSSPLAGRNAPLIKRAEQVLQESPLSGELVEAALVSLKTAVASGDHEETQAAREKLADLLADID